MWLLAAYCCCAACCAACCRRVRTAMVEGARWLAGLALGHQMKREAIKIMKPSPQGPTTPQIHTTITRNKYTQKIRIHHKFNNKLIVVTSPNTCGQREIQPRYSVLYFPNRAIAYLEVSPGALPGYLCLPTIPIHSQLL